jgi:NAD(P) transhydrogenase subunit alpha
MQLTVLAERADRERRVAVVPEVAKRLVGAGWQVAVEAGAGLAASFSDEVYRAAGASVGGIDEVLRAAAVVVGVNPLTTDAAERIPEGVIVLTFLDPAESGDILRVLSARDITYLSFNRLPRISRAQGMDALSSQATVAGYRCALLAAERLPKFFPMLMTAAGTVPPAKVLVLGVGVAGLQAIATARRLGALVKAYDVRTAAKEEAESVGATFLDLGVVAEGTGGYARQLTDDELRRQQDALADEIAASDVVIATAAVPGRRAPILVTTAMVERMPVGAVLVDMAADQGGNCEATVAGEEVLVSGTVVVGLANPASSMPAHASFLYARNVQALLGLLVVDGRIEPDWEDEILASACVLRGGRVCVAGEQVP